jgi:hypothetical protein
MTSAPTQADDYTPEDLKLVQSGCLEVAVRFGDILDAVVVVGGMVPPLLVDLTRTRDAYKEQNPIERHIGTQDLDLGFRIAVLDEERYREISRRLRQHKFEPDKNADGNFTNHRWKHTEFEKLTLDFLISPVEESDTGGGIRNLENDFSAIIIPGLELAFQDIRQVELSGEMLNGSTVTRSIPVCGPGAFVVLKALAWRMRGAQKDAYDLFYIIRNYGEGPEAVANHLRPLLEYEDGEAVSAVNFLAEDFKSPEGAGPIAVSEFVHGHGGDESLKADVAAFTNDLVGRLNV